MQATLLKPISIALLIKSRQKLKFSECGYCGYGKCWKCGCGMFEAKPDDSWWCTCGDHYNDHG
jgi:hypothetical protein